MSGDPKPPLKGAESCVTEIPKISDEVWRMFLPPTTGLVNVYTDIITRFGF